MGIPSILTCRNGRLFWDAWCSVYLMTGCRFQSDRAIVPMESSTGVLEAAYGNPEPARASVTIPDRSDVSLMMIFFSIVFNVEKVAFLLFIRK